MMSSLLEMQYYVKMEKAKKRLEHAYAVMAWALSLQPDIQADCMEQLNETSGRW